MTDKEIAKQVSLLEKKIEKLKKRCTHKKTFVTDCVDGYFGIFCYYCEKRIQ